MTKYILTFLLALLSINSKASTIELSTIIKSIASYTEKTAAPQRDNFVKELEQIGVVFKTKNTDTLLSTIEMSVSRDGDTSKSFSTLTKIKIFCKGTGISRIIISPQSISPTIANFDLGAYVNNNGISIRLYKCGSENAGDQSVYVYVNSSNKNFFYYFVSEASCGSHGCEIKVEAYFNEKDLEKKYDLVLCK